MPTDQNNGVTPNQNPINDNNVGNPNNNSGNQNIDLNLEGIELNTTDLSDDEHDIGDLSADSLFVPTTSSDAESVEANGGVDDRLLKEDKAVQESENAEVAVQPSTPVQSESVEMPSESAEVPSEPAEMPGEPVQMPSEPEAVNNEPVGNGGVDLSGLKDSLVTEPVEAPSVSVETPSQPIEVTSEPEVVNNEPEVVNNEPVQNGGADVSGLSDGLVTEPVETPVSDDTYSVQPESVETPSQPIEVTSELEVVNNEPEVVNNEPVQNGGADVSGLSDGLVTEPVETPVSDDTYSVQPESVEMPSVPAETSGVPAEASSVPAEMPSVPVEVPSESIVSNNEPVENEGVNLSGISETLDMGGTDLDAPSDINGVSVGEISNNINDGISADSLTIENVGVPVVQDGAGNMVSDTGDFSGREDGYIPNESEFQKMSNLLDGSKPGQVEIPADAVVQSSQAGVAASSTDNSKGVFNLDYVVSSLQDSEKKHSVISNTDVSNAPEVENTQPNIPDNTLNNNVVGGDMQVVGVPNTGNVAPVQPVMGQFENVQNDPVQGQGYVYQPNVPMNMPQSPVPPVVTSNDTGNNGVQAVAPKTHHGPSALVIILIVVVLLGAVAFILYKMYPDVVSSIFGKNNISIEYTNNETSLNLLGDDENSTDTDDTGELTGEGDLGDESLTGDKNEDTSDDAMDDVLDPDTLTALLQGNNENSDSDDLDSDDTGETIKEIHGSSGDSGEDIETYKDLGLLLDEEKSDKNEILKKLNDYKAQGIIYQDWGTENDNQGAYKYGTYIVKKTTAMIESIETTGEMDMNEIEKIFDTFDGYLSKLETLKSN